MHTIESYNQLAARVFGRVAANVDIWPADNGDGVVIGLAVGYPHTVKKTIAELYERNLITSEKVDVRHDEPVVPNAGVACQAYLPASIFNMQAIALRQWNDDMWRFILEEPTLPVAAQAAASFMEAGFFNMQAIQRQLVQPFLASAPSRHYLMPEMAHAGKGHGQAAGVGGFDHILVAD